jgi:predicted amidohydrolase YtcJ
MDSLHADGELGSRLRIYLWAPGTVSLDEACAHAEWSDFTSSEDLIKIHGVKMFSDGGYSAASAAVKKPYVHDGHHHCGEVALSADQIGEALAKTAAAGLQLAIHANGDRAQEEVCQAIITAGGAPAGVPAPRVEHAGNFLPDPAATALWRDAGIIPVPQPVFLYTFGDFFPTYLGEYGTLGRFPFRRLVDEGWAITGSSDVWIGSEDRATNPFFSIWNCLKRESFFGETLDGDQAITLAEALRMHTINGARTLGEESRYGSLEVGKKADVIVLDRDPFECSADELLDIGVDAVYLAGRLVHEAAGRPVHERAPESANEVPGRSGV